MASHAPPAESAHHPSLDQDPEDVQMTDASSGPSALEVDSSLPDSSDAESMLSHLSSTKSATSSVYDVVEEHGRTYHKYKEGKYVLPNDVEEQNRLDLQHQVMLKVLDERLHLSPISEATKHVLDIGTGTGIWAIEFAQKYPWTEVVGSDLSPIQPEYVPANCSFEIDDAEDEWLYSTRFDFIHWRLLMTCFKDPRFVIEQAWKQLAPGGYLELQDGVFPLRAPDQSLEGRALDRWAKACHAAGEKMGRPWDNTPHYKRWMLELGFEDVKEKVFEIPTNPWPRGRKAKELGMWFCADVSEGLSASKVLFIKALGWEPEATEAFLEEVRGDLRDRGCHAYMPL
jgi:SAM-dependent methyltransferase